MVETKKLEEKAYLEGTQVPTQKERLRRRIKTCRQGSILIKYPSPLHWMHYSNSTYRINGRMTLKQCLYSLQATLSLPARVDETSIHTKIQSSPNGGMRWSPSYLKRKGAPSVSERILGKRSMKCTQSIVTDQPEEELIP